MPSGKKNYTTTQLVGATSSTILENHELRILDTFSSTDLPSLFVHPFEDDRLCSWLTSPHTV
jgi:hypothetical protein